MVKREIGKPEFKMEMSKLEMLGLEKYVDNWVNGNYPAARHHAELMDLSVSTDDFTKLQFSDDAESFWIDDENRGKFIAVTENDVVVLASNNEQNEIKYWEI